MNNLWSGRRRLPGVMRLGVLATLVHAGGMTFVLVKLLEWTLGLRVSEEDERMGLDITQHGEQAYRLF